MPRKEAKKRASGTAGEPKSTPFPKWLLSALERVEMREPVLRRICEALSDERVQDWYPALPSEKREQLLYAAALWVLSDVRKHRTASSNPLAGHLTSWQYALRLLEAELASPAEPGSTALTFQSAQLAAVLGPQNVLEECASAQTFNEVATLTSELEIYDACVNHCTVPTMSFELMRVVLLKLGETLALRSFRGTKRLRTILARVGTYASKTFSPREYSEIRGILDVLQREVRPGKR